MKFLAIESSCDETAAAVTSGRKILSSVVASQISEHQKYGGVVPEIASRRHIENIAGVTGEALDKAGCSLSGLDGIAVTYAPGLIGALLVGVNYAKGLSMASGLPLIPVHHLRSHIAANYITNKNLEPPFLCLVASGGHSHIVEVLNYTEFNVIGRTRDDAAGECFDKTARAMGLPYPGGVHLDKIAEKGDKNRYKLPHPKIEGSEWDFSFSGLKTAAINLIHNCRQKDEPFSIPDLAASIRNNVCEILTNKTLSAAEALGYKKVAIAGGVSANSELRKMFGKSCNEKGIEFYLPESVLCGDNAAMVGVQGEYEFLSGNIADMSLNAAATMPI